MASNESKPRILVVDNEQGVLDGLERSHGETYDLRTARGPIEGLKAIKNEAPFAVVVSEYKMPGLDGARFLARVEISCPSTIRVMMSGDADPKTAIDAVNTGHVYGLLSKPMTAEGFRKCIDAAVMQHRVRAMEHDIAKQTVLASIEILVDVLAVANPEAFGRSKRLKEYVGQIARRMGLHDVWRFETAALLSQVGLLCIPPEILDRMHAKAPLSEPQEQVLARHPQTARDLLAKIPRLECVARMIAAQGGAKGDVPEDPEVQLGGEMLRCALEFERKISNGTSQWIAVQSMAKQDRDYNADVLKALESIQILESGRRVRQLMVKDLRVGMLIDQDVLTRDAAMIVTSGNMITRSMLERLRNYAELRSLDEPIRVLARIPGWSATAA